MYVGGGGGGGGGGGAVARGENVWGGGGGGGPGHCAHVCTSPLFTPLQGHCNLGCLLLQWNP